VIFLMAAGLLSSCSREGEIAGTGASTTPYGVWTWDDAYVVVILRSGRYTFCDRSTCFEDSVDTSNPNYVRLEDFYRQPLGQQFGRDAYRDDAVFESFRAAVSGSMHPHDLDFSVNRPLAKPTRTRCKRAHCVAIGHLQDGAIFERVAEF
jgi:hypothetical protein